MIGFMLLLATMLLTWYQLWRSRFTRWWMADEVLEVLMVFDEPCSTEKDVCRGHREESNKVVKSVTIPWSKHSQSVFVKFRVHGKEFWWFSTDTADLVFDVATWASVPARKYPLVQAATLCCCDTEAGAEQRFDVTTELQQLSGPSADFYGKHVSPQLLSDFLDAVTDICDGDDMLKIDLELHQMPQNMTHPRLFTFAHQD
jgi:hypothetical protein